MSNIIDFRLARIEKGYSEYLSDLSHEELLEEMVRWGVERLTEGLNKEIVLKGVLLFNALHDTANSEELREFTFRYKTFLESKR